MKEGKDLPPDLAAKLDKGNAARSPDEASSASDDSALREKVTGSYITNLSLSPVELEISRNTCGIIRAAANS